MADQLAFAALSGDYNPMHMDVLAARRTQAGAPVVHGMHALLWALEELAAAELIGPPLCEIRAQFRKFTYLDAACDLEVTRWDSNAARAGLCSNGLVLTTIQLRNGPRQATGDGTELAEPEVAIADGSPAGTLTARSRRSSWMDGGGRCAGGIRVCFSGAGSRRRKQPRRRVGRAVAPGRNGVSGPALDLCRSHCRSCRVAIATFRHRFRSH